MTVEVPNLGGSDSGEAAVGPNRSTARARKQLETEVRTVSWGDRIARLATVKATKGVFQYPQIDGR